MTRVYFDASGSMRGFGLAAAANQRQAGDAFGSVLLALRNLPGLQQSNANAAANGGTAAPSPVAVFGSALKASDSLESILDSALGRRDSRLPSGGLGPSSDCAGGAKWDGAAVTRARIDSLFGEGRTCLDQVFEDILTNGQNDVNVIVTDAEQNAPLNDRGCPNPKNLGTIQSYVNRWSEDGRFVAIIAMGLPYQPWRGGGASYCDCQTRLLFVYVLAPSADSAERIFAHVKNYWKADLPPPLYVPLMPRPAVSYELRVVTGASDSGATMIFPSDAAATELEPAEIGRLPQVWMQLNNGEGHAAFSVEKIGFRSTNLDMASAVDPLKAPLEWSIPVPLNQKGQPQKDGPSPLSLVRMNSPIGKEEEPAAANVRTARFLGQSSQPQEAKPGTAAPLRLRIRRAGASNGCQWYLVEATSPRQEHLEYVLNGLPEASGPCMNWTDVREQVRTAFQSAPVMRFLLHVDY